MSGVIAAAGIGAAGAIGSAVLPKIMGGSSSTSGGQGVSGNTSNQSGPVTGSPYEGFENQQLANINGLSSAPFKPYDVNSMFAPFNATQNQAFNQVQGLQGSYQPYFGNASNSLSQNNGAAYSPTGAAATAFGNAASTPSALSTASPYATAAGQPSYSTIQPYMNSFTNNAVNAANQLQSSNFTNNVMPGLNNMFVGSGGGMGSPQYDNAANMALTNFNQNVGNTTQTALANGWNSAMNANQADLTRQAGLASTMGSLAVNQQAGNTALGTAQSNNAALGAQTNIANANAWSGLGTGYLNNGLLASNALLQTGNQQQQQAQNPLTAAYQQFEQGIQWPYQTAQFAANTANQYSWPMQSNTQNNSVGSNNSTGTATGSPLGTGLGLAAGVGSILGGFNGQGTDPLASVGSTAAQAAANAAGPVTISSKRGGYFKDTMEKQGFMRGGYLDLNRNTMPWFMAPFTNKDGSPQIGYAKGGYFGGASKEQVIRAVHEHEMKMHEAKRNELTRIHLAQGGYLDLNRDTMPFAMSPFPANDMGPQIGYAEGGYLDLNRSSMPFAMSPFRANDSGPQIGYFAGGVVPVIKAMRDNTKRSLKASQAKAKADELRGQMARPDLPLDLSPRSGHFSQ